MGWLKKFKKALGLENKRKIPKQESKPAPKASTRKAAPKYSDRAPNVQKMKAKEAYRAKREVTAHKAVSSMSKGTKQTFKKNTQKSPVQRFNAGLIRGGAMMGLPSTKGMPKTVKNSTAFKAGNVVGTAASYLGGYGAVGKGLAKGTVKIAAKSAPRAAKTGLTTKSFLSSAKKGDDLLKGAKTAVKVGEKHVGKKLPVNRYAVDKGTRIIEKATRKDTTKALKRLGKEIPEAKGVKGNVAKKIASTNIVQKGAKQAVKASGAKEGTKAFERAVEREALKKGEKVVSDIGKKVKQNVIADATAGTVLDTTHAVGDDIKIGSDEYRDYMAKNAAMNVGFGVGAEALGGIVKGVKTLRNGKKVVEIEKDGKITHRVIKGDMPAPTSRVPNTKGQVSAESEKVALKPTEAPSLASEDRGTVTSQYERAQKRVRKGETVRAQAQAMDVARRESPDIYSERLPLPQIGSKGKGRTGYHAGDLGKAEYHHNQAGSSRHTGAFGTGTYFAGDKNILKEGGYKNRPLHEVNYDNYKLYRPKDKTQGLEVHDDLRVLNRESQNIKKLSRRMNTGDKEIEKMRKVFDDSTAEYSPRNLARVEEIADDVLSKGEIERIRLDAKDAFKKSKKTMTKEEAERLATKDAEDMQAELADYELSMSQEEIDRYMSERIESYMKGGGKSEEEYYFDYLKYELDEQIHGDLYGSSKFLDDIEKSKEIIPRLAKNLGKPEDEVRKAFDEMVETVSKYGDVNPKSKLDSASTVLMKKLGYDGVDVTGIKGLDNTEYGSVIYDLKPEAPSGTPGLKRAKLQRPEEVSALKAATDDKAFVEKVKSGDIDIKKMAEDEGISMREATIKAHENFRKPDIKTAKGAEEEVLGAPAKVLTRRPEVEGGLMGKVKGAYDFFIRNVVDNTHEIARMAKKYGDDSVVHLLDRAKSVVSNADNMINGDRQVILLKNGGSIENGESLKKIFKPIMDKGEAYEQDFADFMYHRMNATYRHDAGSDVFGGGMTKEESERIYKELLEKHPEFEEEAEKVYKYLDGLNQIEMDAGRLTREQYEWMKENNPYYVPSYRQKYIDSGAGVVTHGNSIGGSVNRRAVGSNSDIAPLHEQLAFETYRRMEASAFNDLGLRITKDLGDDAIVSIKRLDGKKVAADEILDAEKGEFPKHIEEEGGAYYLNVRDGDQIYKVGINKDLFDALDAIHKAPKKWPIAYQANSVFRNLVTNYNPLFAVRNGVRDFLDAPAFSKYPAAFYKNYARAWKHMTSDSELWKTYKDLGGTAESFIDVAKQWQDGNWFRRNLLQRIETLNSAVEQAPRFAEFLSTIEKKGNTKEGLLEALNNAHEITLNFGRHGDVGMTLNANGFTFLNAGIQDAARIARVFKNAKSNPAALGRLFVGASMLGIAPSVINELALGDRKEYQDLRTSEKDLNFLIPMDWFPGVDTNEKFLKIPKGRVSSVFAMPIQRAIREQQGNTKVGETMTTGLGEDIREQIAPMNPFTNNLAEPLRQASSKDGKTWYGATIVPSSMADKKPEDQTDENTTRLATFIGKQTGLSPKRLDYLLQQYGGVIYQAGKGLPAVGKPSITGDKISADSAAKAVGTILGSNFVSDSNSNNGYSNMVYDHTAKLKTYKDDSVADNMAYKYMSVGQSKIGELSKQIKEVNADKNLSAEEKQKRVREIRREQIKVSKQYLGNEQKAKKVANSVASSMDKKDFTTKSGEYSENKYNAALKEQMRVKLDGAKALVAEEDAKAKPGEKTLSQKLKKAGISAEKYYEYKAQGATLAQVKKAKERGISPETYVGAQQAKKGSKSFGETLCRWIDNGYVKNFEDFEVFDPGAKKNTWNAVVWAKNHNMSTKKIAKVIGTDTASNQENRQRIKKYGSSASGKFYTSDGLYKYIESEHGNLSRKEKALMYKYYGYGYSWFQNRNPYL